MKTRTVPSTNYAAGTYVQNIPPAAQRTFIGATMRLTRESWPAGVDYALSDGSIVPNTACAVRLERTVNDVDWLKVGAWTFPGGIRLNRDGSERLEDSLQIAFFDGQGQPIADNGDLRVILEALVPLRTGITAEMREVGD